MRLTPGRVTAASRRTLPAYPVFCAVVGPVWMFDPGSRVGGSEALTYAGRITPILGFLCTLIAVYLAACLVLGWVDHADRWHARTLYTYGLGALIVWLVLLAGVLVFAAAAGAATLSAWIWPGLVAWLMWASAVSLASDESTP